jgi:hypothetical protein
MRFELEQFHRNLSEDELIADLRQVASTLCKNSVPCSEYDDNGRFHSGTYRKRFGTWSNACEKAGLQMTRAAQNSSIEELFRNLEEVWVRLGRQPRFKELSKPFSRYSVKTYKTRFGTWQKALKAFVDFINEEEMPSKQPTVKTGTTRHIKQQATRHINWRLHFVVMRRDNFKCKACGRSPATDPTVTLDVDHIKAWIKGGLTIMENLQTLCTKCNIGKSDLEFIDESVIEVQNVEA